MKRVYLPIIGFVALLAGVGFLMWKSAEEAKSDHSNTIAVFESTATKDSPREEEEEDIKAWEEFTRLARANQVTGKLDPMDMLRAREEVSELISRTKLSRAGLNLDWMFMGPSNKGGRTRDILFDKDNPSRMYTGGVSGGLWYSNNEGESWIPYDKDDTLAGIGVVSLTQSASGDIYVGTGEDWPGATTGGAFGGGFLGFGIWKSSDGGNTFQHLASTTPSATNITSANWAYVPALGAHPSDGNVIVAGTNKGLKITRDGGQTWANASTNPQLNSSGITDIEVTQSGTVHATTSTSYFRGNIDDPSSFERITIPSKPYARLAIAAAPSDENYVYIIGCNGNGETVGVFQSTDGGDTWNNIGPPSLPSEGFNPTGDQGKYDMEIAVHPLDKEKVFVAGQYSLYTYGIANGKLGWWAISNWGTRQLNPSFDPQYVHADQHRIVFHPTKPDWMYVATDGGVFRTKNARAEYPALPPFSRQNKNYGVAQLHDMSVGIDGKILAGLQDNGTLLIDFKQNEPDQGTFVGGGDGLAVEIAKTNPDAMFSALYYGSASRSSNGGETFSSFFDHNIDCQPRNASGQCSGDGQPDCGVAFKSVFRLWENMDQNDPDYGEGRLFFSTFCGVWVAIDALDFGSDPTWFNIANSSTGVTGGNQDYTCMNLSADGDILYVGTSHGEVYRVDGLRSAVFEYDDKGTPTPDDDTFDPTAAGLTTTRVASFGAGRYVTEIAVDQNDPNIVVVTLGNYGNQTYVYRSSTAATTTGTSSFISIQGNLPKMPVYSVVIDYYNNKNIIVGTEMGIFTSTISGNVWQADLNGMPYAAVLNLNQELINEDGCYSLYAGTYGRGVYQSTTLTPATCKTITGTDPVFKDSNFGLYPNPASDFTKLTFSLDQASEITLDVYSLMGRKVMNRNLGQLTAGGHVIPVNTADLSDGYYLVILTNANQERMVQKMVVTR